MPSWARHHLQALPLCPQLWPPGVPSLPIHWVCQVLPSPPTPQAGPELGWPSVAGSWVSKQANKRTKALFTTKCWARPSPATVQPGGRLSPLRGTRPRLPGTQRRAGRVALDARGRGAPSTILWPGQRLFIQRLSPAHTGSLWAPRCSPAKWQRPPGRQEVRAVTGGPARTSCQPLNGSVFRESAVALPCGGGPLAGPDPTPVGRPRGGGR